MTRPVLHLLEVGASQPVMLVMIYTQEFSLYDGTSTRHGRLAGLGPRRSS
jgi:hypothetical protein